MSELHICTLAEIKANCGVSDTREDDLLAQLAAGLEARFEAHCRRGIWRREDVVDLHSGGGPALYLHVFPVEEVTLVEVGEDALEEDEWALGSFRGRLYRVGRSPWPAGVENIRVTYTGGYVSAADGAVGVHPMPEDLRRALLLQAGYEYRNRESLGRVSISGQGQSISLSPAKLLPEVVEVLQPYRRIA